MWQRRPDWPSRRATTARAALVGGAHLGRGRVGLAQRGRRRVRDERRRAEQHAVEQQHEALDEGVGHDRPARAPAGHRVRLGEARDAGHALLGAVHREHARMRATAEQQRAVDLVGDQPEVVLAAQLARARPASRRACTRPVGLCGVVSTIARVRARDCRLDLGRRRAGTPRSGRSGTCTGVAPAGREDPGIGGVERLRDDDLVALAEHADADGEHRGLRAREEDDAARVHGPPGPGGRALRDLLAQRRIALRVRVVRAPGAHARRTRPRRPRAASRSRDRRS